jgi:type VI protein secretion system component VasF
MLLKGYRVIVSLQTKVQETRNRACGGYIEERIRRLLAGRERRQRTLAELMWEFVYLTFKGQVHIQAEALRLGASDGEVNGLRKQKKITLIS